MTTTEKIIIIPLALTIALYAMFHVGRYYEYQQVQKTLYRAFGESTDTRYQVEDGNDEVGRWGHYEDGRCFTPEGESLLLEYYPMIEEGKRGEI